MGGLSGLGGLGGNGLGGSSLGGSSIGGSSIGSSGSLSRDDRSASFSKSRLGNYMQSEPIGDDGDSRASGSLPEPKPSGASDVPDYHRQAAENDFFAGGGFFGATSGGGLSSLGSDDGDDSGLLIENGDEMEEVVEDSYE